MKKNEYCWTLLPCYESTRVAGGSRAQERFEWSLFRIEVASSCLFLLLMERLMCSVVLCSAETGRFRINILRCVITFMPPQVSKSFKTRPGSWPVYDRVCSASVIFCMS